MHTQRIAVGIVSSLVTIVFASLARAGDRTVCADAYAASQSLRDEHRLLAARDQLRICARQECSLFAGGQIVKDCVSWLVQVEAAIPSIVFEVTDGSGSDLSAVRVTIDGQPLVNKLDGNAIQVDPGEHRFTLERTDGISRAEKTIVVREGDKDRHVRVVVGAPSVTSPRGASAVAAPSGGSTQRTIGLVVGGVGVASVAVGSIFGAMALSGSPCDASDRTCPTQGDHDTLVAHETVANVGLAVGIVGVVVGSYLFFTAPAEGSTKEPASTSIAPWLGLGAAGIAGVFR